MLCSPQEPVSYKTKTLSSFSWSASKVIWFKYSWANKEAIQRSSLIANVYWQPAADHNLQKTYMRSFPKSGRGDSTCGLGKMIVSLYKNTKVTPQEICHLQPSEGTFRVWVSVTYTKNVLMFALVTLSLPRLSWSGAGMQMCLPAWKTGCPVITWMGLSMCSFPREHMANLLASSKRTLLPGDGNGNVESPHTLGRAAHSEAFSAQPEKQQVVTGLSPGCAWPFWFLNIW